MKKSTSFGIVGILLLAAYVLAQPTCEPTSFICGLFRQTTQAGAQSYLGVPGTNSTVTGSGAANQMGNWTNATYLGGLASFRYTNSTASSVRTNAGNITDYYNSQGSSIIKQIFKFDGTGGFTNWITSLGYNIYDNAGIQGLYLNSATTTLTTAYNISAPSIGYSGTIYGTGTYSDNSPMVTAAASTDIGYWIDNAGNTHHFSTSGGISALAFNDTMATFHGGVDATTGHFSGTITNDALSASSPVWSSATKTHTSTAASQTANTFYAAPNGSAGAPTFRAMVARDIPTSAYTFTYTNTGAFGTVYTNANQFQPLDVTACIKIRTVDADLGDVQLLLSATGAPTTVASEIEFGCHNTVAGLANCTNTACLHGIVPPGGSYKINTNATAGSPGFTFKQNIAEILTP